MTVKLEWIPAIEASDRRKAGWIEIELHGGIEAAPGCFLMASPGEEVPKVECPNCGEMTSEEHYLRGGERHESYYRCEKPAQPEPAAPVCPNCKEPEKPHYFFQSLRESSFASPTFVCEPAATVEMPEVVADALIALRSGAFPNLANDLESFWRSQPVAVGISEELDRRAVEIGGDRLVGVSYRPVSETVAVGTWQLEELLKYADLAEVALRTGFHPPEFLFRPADRSLRQVIDAVKKQRDEQRTHAQPVGISEELESVLRSAKEYEMAVRTGTRVEWNAYDADRIGAAIAAVRSQYGRKG